MVSEERNLVGPDSESRFLRKVYEQGYSISRLRDRVERPIDPEDSYSDFWEGVKQTFLLYSDSERAQSLGMAALDGDLFGERAVPQLMSSRLFNKDFLRGFAHLSLFKDDRIARRVNYAHLDVEELGSVYESLLDFHPVVSRKKDTLEFDLATGTERKSTVPTIPDRNWFRSL